MKDSEVIPVKVIPQKSELLVVSVLSLMSKSLLNPSSVKMSDEVSPTKQWAWLFKTDRQETFGGLCSKCQTWTMVTGN